jgi:hypothetical protein
MFLGLQAIAQLVSMFVYGTGSLHSIPLQVFLFFLIAMEIMAVENARYNSCLRLCMYLFSFFHYSHLNMTGALLFPNTSGYGDKVAGFRMMFVVNTVKTQKFVTA